MLRTVPSLPLHRAFDAALRHRAFPPDAGSLLPGPLAATRTGLAPASDDELTTEDQLHIMTSCLLGARMTRASDQGAAVELISVRWSRKPDIRTAVAWTTEG